MSRPTLLLLAGALLLVVTSCGSESGSTATTTGSPSPTTIALARPTAVPAADGEVTTTYPVTVLDDGDGAEVCLGGVADSYPPQCGGPDLVGWDWSEHEGDYENASGVRWGDFVVTGTFDGTALTPTSVVPADEYDAEPVDREDLFATPCPEPAGGWVVDPDRATERDQDAAFRVARRLDDYGSSFVDNSLDPRPIEQVDQDAADGNEPAVSLSIVNVSVTEDSAGAEKAIREVWGGGLCISQAARTEREMRRIGDELIDAVPGFLSNASDDPDVAGVQVTYDDGSIQAWADQEYGAGLVVVSGALVDA